VVIRDDLSNFPTMYLNDYGGDWAYCVYLVKKLGSKLVIAQLNLGLGWLHKKTYP